MKFLCNVILHLAPRTGRSGGPLCGGPPRGPPTGAPTQGISLMVLGAHVVRCYLAAVRSENSTFLFSLRSGIIESGEKSLESKEPPF